MLNAKSQIWKMLAGDSFILLYYSAFESKAVADLYKHCWSCMIKRGVIDVETTLNLQQLLKMSGPHFFVQNLVEVG